MRRLRLFFGSLVGGLFLLASLVAAQEKVVLLENYIFNGAHAAEILAREKGYFAAEGLEVEIVRGYGPGDTLKKVAAGSFPVGFSTSFLDIIGRSQGAPIKAVAVKMQRPPMGVAYLEGTGIKGPRDLEGKRLGGPPGSAVMNLFPAFAKVAGFDAAKVIVVHMDATAIYPSLAAKKVEIAASFLTSFPHAERAASKVGLKARHILFADYGLKDLYGDTLITSEDFLGKKPGVVRGMVRGFLRGLGHLWREPEAGVSAFLKKVPDADPKTIQAEIGHLLTLAADENLERNGLGFADPGKMKAQVEIVAQYFKLGRPVQPEEVYSNDFVLGTPRDWRFPKR